MFPRELAEKLQADGKPCQKILAVSSKPNFYVCHPTWRESNKLELRALTLLGDVHKIAHNTDSPGLLAIQYPFYEFWLNDVQLATEFE